jgi:hypothetical protein
LASGAACLLPNCEQKVSTSQPDQQKRASYIKGFVQLKSPKWLMFKPQPQGKPEKVVRITGLEPVNKVFSSLLMVAFLDAMSQGAILDCLSK